MEALDLTRNCRSAAALLKTMANEHRLAVLCHLATGESSAGELTAAIGLSQSALSQHLARLRDDGLVTTRRASQQIFYSLASAEVLRIMETLHGIYCTSAAPAPAPDPRPTPEEASP